MTRVPDFSLEQESARIGLVIGLDEAGRGPWAGPVVAAAAWLDPARTPPALLNGLDDSKVLHARARETLFAALHAARQDGFAAFAIAEASVTEIDEINSLQASVLAMRRAAARLSESLHAPPATALVDGNKAPDLACSVRTVIKGDSLSLSIAAASILAKVTRDRAMRELATRHPGYGWERNMGYGTAEHRRGLDTLGVTAQHRRSFHPIRERLIA